MNANSQLRSAVRGFYAWIGSMILFALSPLVGVRLVESGTVAGRIGGVVIGAGGILPWMWIVYAMIRRCDEFGRRMHQVAFAWAFAASVFLLVALHWLVTASFIAPPDLMVVAVVCMLFWGVALLGARLYYERQR